MIKIPEQIKAVSDAIRNANHDFNNSKDPEEIRRLRIHIEELWEVKETLRAVKKMQEANIFLMSRQG